MVRNHSKELNPSDIEIPGKNSFVPIGGQVMKSPLPASGRRADDTFDIAVVELNEDLAGQLGHHQFLDIADADPSDQPYKQSLYTFTGFPSTKQKMPEKDQSSAFFARSVIKAVFGNRKARWRYRPR